jgi:hypothetical protein
VIRRAIKRYPPPRFVLAASAERSAGGPIHPPSMPSRGGESDAAPLHISPQRFLDHLTNLAEKIFENPRAHSFWLAGQIRADHAIVFSWCPLNACDRFLMSASHPNILIAKPLPRAPGVGHGVLKHVGSWHFSDLPPCPLARRSWSMSGHKADIAESTFMTRNGLRQTPLPCGLFMRLRQAATPGPSSARNA